MISGSKNLKTLRPQAISLVVFSISLFAFLTRPCQYIPSQNTTTPKSGKKKSGMHLAGLSHCSSNEMPARARADDIAISIFVRLFGCWRWARMPLHFRLHVFDVLPFTTRRKYSTPQEMQVNFGAPPNQFFAPSPRRFSYPQAREQNRVLRLGFTASNGLPQRSHIREVVRPFLRTSLSSFSVSSLCFRPRTVAACFSTHSFVLGTCFLQWTASLRATIAAQPGNAHGCFGLGMGTQQSPNTHRLP